MIAKQQHFMDILKPSKFIHLHIVIKSKLENVHFAHSYLLSLECICLLVKALFCFQESFIRMVLSPLHCVDNLWTFISIFLKSFYPQYISLLLISKCVRDNAEFFFMIYAKC